MIGGGIMASLIDSDWVTTFKNFVKSKINDLIPVKGIYSELQYGSLSQEEKSRGFFIITNSSLTESEDNVPVLDVDDTLKFKDGILGVTLPIKPLIKSEYNALTMEEKMSEIQYIITDDENVSDGSILIKYKDRALGGGIPSGGTEGQYLSKKTNEDYDAQWVDPPASIAPPGSNVPSGGIIIWSGLADAVPDGWALCDGTNGTPDLRGRFVLGALDAEHEIGQTGGSEEVTLTIEQMPTHHHVVEVATIGSQFTKGGSDTCMKYIKNKVSTLDTGGSNPHPNMPPYYVLSYIMKL